jgi:hypothetical protein
MTMPDKTAGDRDGSTGVEKGSPTIAMNSDPVSRR